MCFEIIVSPLALMHNRTSLQQLMDIRKHIIDVYLYNCYNTWMCWDGMLVCFVAKPFICTA